MKGMAAFHSKVALSLAQAAGVSGNGIDCLGFTEALPFVLTSQLGGTDPVYDVNWEESADNVTFTTIVGADHKQMLLDVDLIVASVNLTNIAFTIAAQPSNPARMHIVVVDTTPSITAGTLYIVGTRLFIKGEEQTAGGPTVVSVAQTEIIDCSGGGATYKSVNVYNAITSITAGIVTGVAGTVDFVTLGGSGNETIEVGSDNSAVYVPHEGRINLVNRKRYLRAAATEGGTTTGACISGLVLMSPDRKPVARVGGVEFSID